MAGEARTTRFALSSGTVMLGPMASLYDLTPTQNSIGLVKNIQCACTPTYQELTQGAKGSIVYSVMTNNPVKVSFEVYEYTATNIAWGLGQEGDALVTATASGALTTALTGNTTTPVTTAAISSATDNHALFTAGSWVSFQTVVGTKTYDQVHIAQLTANATVTGSGPYITTLTFANQGLKTGNNFSVGDLVSLVATQDVGSKVEQPYVAAKIVAVLPAGNTPVIILLPKVRIIKGFSLSLNETNYTNLPFELEPYEQIPTDPFYSLFGGTAKYVSVPA